MIEWTRPDFFDHALCSSPDVDRKLFFPEEAEKRGGKTDWSPARAVCEQCQVKTECAEWSISTGERDGMWGGLSPSQRGRIRRARDKIRPVTSLQPGWERDADLISYAVVELTRRLRESA